MKLLLQSKMIETTQHIQNQKLNHKAKLINSTTKSKIEVPIPPSAIPVCFNKEGTNISIIATGKIDTATTNRANFCYLCSFPF